MANKQVRITEDETKLLEALREANIEPLFALQDLFDGREELANDHIIPNSLRKQAEKQAEIIKRHILSTQ